MKKFLNTILFFVLSSQLLASECQENFSYALPSAKLGEKNSNLNFWNQPTITQATCFDSKLLDNEPNLKTSLERLKNDGIFDENNCLTDKQYSDADADSVFQIMRKTLETPMHIYALSDSATGEIKKVVLTNSSNPDFAKNALTAKDKMELAGITLLSSGIGILIERNAFKGEHDKLLHANYGALINIGSNLASYAIIEELKVGDKLNLSRNQKKMAILLTGTAMGAIIGYAKERFYDYYRRKSHTYDPHFKGDMGATMLGGGAVTPFLLTFSTSW
jgi:hypothetical protein